MYYKWAPGLYLPFWCTPHFHLVIKNVSHRRRLPHSTMGKTWAMLINYLLKVPQPLKLNRKLSHVRSERNKARMWLTHLYIAACIQSIKTNINGNHNRPESGGFPHILCTLKIKISYRIIHKKYAHVRLLLFIKAHNIISLRRINAYAIAHLNDDNGATYTKRKHGPVGSQRAHNQWSQHATKMHYDGRTHTYGQRHNYSLEITAIFLFKRSTNCSNYL